VGDSQVREDLPDDRRIVPGLPDGGFERSAAAR
jgi:hypothetical protein